MTRTYFFFLAALLLSCTTAFVPPAATFIGSSQQQQQQQQRQLLLQRRTLQHHQMVAIDTSDIKNGLTVELDDGEPYRVLSFSIMKQARGAAKTTIKFKNLMRGNTIENTYRSGEKFETAMIEKNAAVHTYRDENNNFFFMDSQSFEEIAVDSKIMEGKEDWCGEGMECTLIYFKDKVIEVALPSPTILEIVETEPNIKGNTAQGYTKPAKLSCGATINVPGYLERGQMIRVDTEKKEFLERVN